MAPAQGIHTLKAALKFGPRFESREARTEFLLCQTGAAPRRLKPETLEKIRGEIQRLSQSTNPRARRFAQQMSQRYPGLAG
jgi:hypothetical protein